MCCSVLSAGRFRSPSLQEIQSPVLYNLVQESNYIVLTLQPGARRHERVRISAYEFEQFNPNKSIDIVFADPLASPVCQLSPTSSFAVPSRTSSPYPFTYITRRPLSEARTSTPCNSNPPGIDLSPCRSSPAPPSDIWVALSSLEHLPSFPVPALQNAPQHEIVPSSVSPPPLVIPPRSHSPPRLHSPPHGCSPWRGSTTPDYEDNCSAQLHSDSLHIDESLNTLPTCVIDFLDMFPSYDLSPSSSLNIDPDTQSGEASHHHDTSAGPSKRQHDQVEAAEMSLGTRRRRVE
ncbi:hypothetical protein OBBRIDRAFT_798269 [Obba rivulosa]|uniref:Uncharacterized protein n=1 Tax=Obba rivulosa TaxID=1052685 RepID=A0A8E2AN94_9APHY|nr:hypothetical protein OBBRIDRAFT_798269 [Obba rivulosa]